VRIIKVSVIIPTFNAEKYIQNILENINSQDYEVIIIDSGSTDNTLNIVSNYQCKIIQIKKSEFNHGGTRNIAAKLSKGDIVVFLTQDAVPVDRSAIEKLIEPIIKNDYIGMVYGRQLPHQNAKLMGSFARIFNYPNKSCIKNLKDVEKLGIKTVFCSNSFSAYKKSIFEEVGMFPNHVILSEDTYVAAKMILAGYSIAYVAEAMVYHSHDYTILEEFKRYFDIGVFYGRENWILKNFSSAEGEGLKFVKEQAKFLLKNYAIHLYPELIIRNIAKYIGYRMGLNEKKIPLELKRKLSMHKGYWDKNH
jgi:rhamnosyltransferase